MVITTEVYGREIGVALRASWGDRRHAAKKLALLADTTARTTQNWMSGLCGPHASALLLLMAREPAVAAAVQSMVERQRGLDADLAARRARRAGSIP